MILDFNDSKILLSSMQRLHDRARFDDRYFSSENYQWVIGIDIWNAIVAYTRKTIPFIIHDDVRSTNYLYGIKVELDYIHTERCQLFKEIKE